MLENPGTEYLLQVANWQESTRLLSRVR